MKFTANDYGAEAARGAGSEASTDMHENDAQTRSDAPGARGVVPKAAPAPLGRADADLKPENRTPDPWQGRQWRFVWGPKDLETGTRKCRHAQRHPRMRHLPLPRAGLLVHCIAKDGRTYSRETARSRRNDRAVINLIPVEFES